MTKPDGVSDADFQKQKTQLGALLDSVAGFSALQLKDNATAEKDLRAAVEADPATWKTSIRWRSPASRPRLKMT